MGIRVSHTLDDLERDMKAMPRKAAVGTAKIVRENAKLGNKIAKANAKSSAGKHGKHYHKSFSAEAVDAFTWVYGPDSSKPQGDMSFEFGSRQQKPHLDLAKSADIVEFQMLVDVKDLLRELFWP